MPAVKVSVQAVALQMAAAKLHGQASYGKYDGLTVSMSPPDATIALLSGSGEVNNVFSVPPFQQQQLEKPGVRTILNSFDIMDGPHTFTVAGLGPNSATRIRHFTGAMRRQEATEMSSRIAREPSYWTRVNSNSARKVTAGYPARRCGNGNGEFHEGSRPLMGASAR